MVACPESSFISPFQRLIFTVISLAIAEEQYTINQDCETQSVYTVFLRPAELQPQ
jgi:hypothetical protein